MENKSKRMDSFKLDRILFAVGALILLGISIFVMMDDLNRDWRYYQSEFYEIVLEEQGAEKADQIQFGINQIYIKELNRVDRCMTCHLGIKWVGLNNVEQPWKSHPDTKLLRDHPIEKYGCTSCHGGQGYALSEYEAHGFVQHWEEPVLGKLIGSEYDPRNPAPLGQINCNHCHRYERYTRGMDYINHAKMLVRKKGCKICHIINGTGGKMGPDLSNEGEKHAESFDFSNFSTENLSVLNWHINHFKSPLSVVPNSIMPEMNFQTKDAIALSMLVMSWRDNSEIPLEYLPSFEIIEERTPEEIEKEKRMLSGDGAFFVENSCFVCHSIKAFDIESPTEKGPDLSYAPDDVRTRFNKTLEEFLFNPTGTMKIILESQIILSDAQKHEAITKIKKAYEIVKKDKEQME